LELSNGGKRQVFAEVRRLPASELEIGFYVGQVAAEENLEKYLI
jgi:hypothetical protein